MTFEQIKELRNIKFTHEINVDYRYDVALRDNSLRSKAYYPMCIGRNNGKHCIYNYFVTAQKYLEKKNITPDTIGNIFVGNTSATTNLINIADITLEEAQQIINCNIYLFNKINAIALENEMLAQLKQM